MLPQCNKCYGTQSRTDLGLKMKIYSNASNLRRERDRQADWPREREKRDTDPLHTVREIEKQKQTQTETKKMLSRDNRNNIVKRHPNQTYPASVLTSVQGERGGLHQVYLSMHNYQFTFHAQSSVYLFMHSPQFTFSCPVTSLPFHALSPVYRFMPSP